MKTNQGIYIGTDSGATTTKFSAVWENGETISTKVLQRPTGSEKGREAVISGWIAGIGEFLGQNQLQWAQVQGVGLAIPGPYERYGVLPDIVRFRGRPADFRLRLGPRGLPPSRPGPLRHADGRQRRRGRG